MKPVSPKPTNQERCKVHPAVWIVLFFVTLAGLQTSFYIVASTQPDDRIERPAPGSGG